MNPIAVRVATSNNFNCTPAEWYQLSNFKLDNPHASFFVNANIRTPRLSSVNNHDSKIVITYNPDLTIPTYKTAKKMYEIDKKKVAFLRVKWIPDYPVIDEHMEILAKAGYPIVVTLQRFNKESNILKYTSSKHYKWSHSRWRLTGPALKKITSLVDLLARQGNRVWICDRKGLGCQGCGLCSQLTTGQDLQIYSLNMSSSGICPYSCPDCYAKTMQHFCTAMGNSAIRYDVIKKNNKQSGKTAHIKERHEQLSNNL